MLLLLFTVPGCFLKIWHDFFLNEAVIFGNNLMIKNNLAKFSRVFRLPVPNPNEEFNLHSILEIEIYC